MKISLIVAMASNGSIGLEGQMPWHLSADLKRFKQITLGSPLIMGRKTFESIGKPLPDRINIIITRNIQYQQPDCFIFNDITDALNYCLPYPEVFVIGGASLYQSTLSRADYLYLTQINKEFTGDTFFPQIDRREWLELERLDINSDQSVDFSYSFLKLKQLK